LLTACEQDQDGTEFHPAHARKLSANLYDIPVLCVHRKTPDDGQRNCLKHAEFYSKNKFEKLVHLVGFIIRKISTKSDMCIYTYFSQYRDAGWAKEVKNLEQQ
jgi:hypothetical protein